MKEWTKLYTDFVHILYRLYRVRGASWELWDKTETTLAIWRPARYSSKVARRIFTSGRTKNIFFIWVPNLRASEGRAPNSGVTDKSVNHYTMDPTLHDQLKYFCMLHGDQRVFSIYNHHKCLSCLFPLHLNTYVMGIRVDIINYFFLSARGPSLDVRIWRL